MLYPLYNRVLYTICNPSPRSPDFRSIMEKILYVYRSQFREYSGVSAEFFDSLSLSLLLPDDPSVSLLRGHVFLEDLKAANSLTSKPNRRYLFQCIYMEPFSLQAKLV